MQVLEKVIHVVGVARIEISRFRTLLKNFRPDNIHGRLDIALLSINTRKIDDVANTVSVSSPVYENLRKSPLPLHAPVTIPVARCKMPPAWQIPSYTPTLKALGYAQERAAMTTSIPYRKPELLITSIAHYPGQVRLPRVQAEATQVKKVVQCDV